MWRFVFLASVWGAFLECLWVLYLCVRLCERCVPVCGLSCRSCCVRWRGKREVKGTEITRRRLVCLVVVCVCVCVLWLSVRFLCVACLCPYACASVCLCFSLYVSVLDGVLSKVAGPLVCKNRPWRFVNHRAPLNLSLFAGAGRAGHAEHGARPDPPERPAVLEADGRGSDALPVWHEPRGGAAHP